METQKQKYPEATVSHFKSKNLRVPWLPSGWDSTLSLLRALIQSLVKEVRSLQAAQHSQNKINILFKKG